MIGSLAEVLIANRDDREALGPARRANGHRVAHLFVNSALANGERQDTRASLIELVDADDGDLALAAGFVNDGHGRAEMDALVGPAGIA